MAMLAERKRKEKWSLNPRGKHWSEDSNKFGQKLLEKMGWSAGKGLGAKEDGITEHIRVYHKNDSKGVGYKVTDDQWTQHESNFSQLLNSLSGSNGDENIVKENEIKLESLEKKSQNSRARVHYHKFTRGKDLSRYSEKDLANIFGKKTLTEKTNAKNEEPLQETHEEIKNFGVETHNRGSMLDYFKRKMSNHKKHDLNSELKSTDVKSDSEVERPSFGFGFNVVGENNMKSSFISYIKENVSDNGNGNAESEQFKKCKKNKKLESTYVDTNEDVLTTGLSTKINLKRKSENELKLAFTPLKKKFKNFESLNSLQDEEKIEITPTKKCKKKKFKRENKDGESNKNKQKGFAENAMENLAFNPSFNGVAVEKHLLDVIEEENEDYQEESPKKNSVECKVETGNVSLKNKKKKKNKLRFGNENTDFKTVCNGLENPAYNDISVEKCTLEVIQEEDIQEEVSEKKDKSKKKKKSKSKEGIDNSCFEDSAEESLSSLTIEGSTHVDEPTATSIDKFKKKSKKSKKEKKLTKCGSENSAFNENIVESTTIKKCEYSELENDEKKKKSEPGVSPNELNEVKKKKKYETSDVNCKKIPVVQECNEDIQDFQQKASNLKKRKKGECVAIDNPCFNPNDSIDCSENTTSLYEVKRKKKNCNLGIDNAGLDLTTPSPKKQKSKEIRVPLELEMPIMDEEIILNVVDTPILKKEGETSAQRRKNVRFSKVDQRIFMNNMDSPADLRKNGSKGVNNEAYDELGNHLEENIDTLSKQLDDYQAEVENDMNEAKMEVMVGEMGDPNGENQILPNGDVKLKFKYAKFGRTPPWLKKTGDVSAKTSYRHLIKGDIVLGFKNSNLHEIMGYGKIKHDDN